MPTAHRLAAPPCLTLLLAAVVWLAAPPASAGCGCDHPPPAWSEVMPPFGSPGRTLTLLAEGLSLQTGALYEVDFGSGPTVAVQAVETDRVEVDLPGWVPPGPATIDLTGPGVDLHYPDSAFTALPPARRIKEKFGTFTARSYEAAVGADGTLYLAVDVSDVMEAMQFTFALHGVPLRFEHDDVVIYNADGVDLTLFTLDVENATERQWGSYHGWTVESDHGLVNDYYLPQTDDSDDPLLLTALSSIFTYWRHEFHTYAAAHAPGGSHEVGADGAHPDGTLHVDHERLIIAIQGVERDASDPLDLSLANPLAPGSRVLDVAWLSVLTQEPVEMPLLSPMVEDDIEDYLEELEEIFEAD